MKIIADLHTHTVASTHAYSTVLENVRAAKEKKLQAIALTDHGPASEDGAHRYHFLNIQVIDRKIDGIFVLRGAEANIMEGGGVDIADSLLENLDFVIASFHDSSFPPVDFDTHTQTVIKLLDQPYVDCMGHPGNGKYKFDYEKVIPMFKERDKLIEINSNSFRIRSGSAVNCREILKLCKKYEVSVAVTSDAHFCTDVGNFKNALEIIDEIGFPEELVLNSDFEKVKNYIESKRNIKLNEV